MGAVLSGLLFASTAALACGYCVEDKIAATYDHEVVTQALARKHQVAYLHVDGKVASRKALEQAAYAVPAVDRGTVRVSADLLTVSFAFDPARASLGAIHPRIEKKLGVALMPLQVMERPGDLKAVNAPR
jgi:hypothetical protein